MGEQGEINRTSGLAEALREIFPAVSLIFRTLADGFFFIEIPIVEVKTGHDYQGGRDNQWSWWG